MKNQIKFKLMKPKHSDKITTSIYSTADDFFEIIFKILLGIKLKRHEQKFPEID